MKHNAQRTAALELLAKTGMWPSNYAPPLWHLLWHLGLNLPPPHFVGFASIVAVLGTGFAAVWGMTMWFFVWSITAMSPGVAMITAVASGACFGLLMAGYYAYGRHKYRLPTWDALGRK